MKTKKWIVSARNVWGVKIEDYTIKAKTRSEAVACFLLEHKLKPYRAVEKK